MLSRCGLLKFNFLTLSAMIPPELLLQGYRSCDRRRLFRRIDVSPGQGRFQSRAGGPGRTPTCEDVRSARHAMAYTASRAIRRNRNFAHSLFACPTESVGIAQKILGYGAPPGAPAVWRKFAICEARQRNIQSCATIRLSQTAATMFGVRA